MDELKLSKLIHIFIKINLLKYVTINKHKTYKNKFHLL